MKRILWSVVIAAIITLLVHTDALAQNRVAQPIDPSTNAATVAVRGVSARPSTPTEEEFDKLKAVVADQQKRIEQLEQTLDDQRKLIEQALHVSPGSRDGNQTITAVNVQPANAAEILSAQLSPAEPIAKAPADDVSPLSIRIGKVSVTPYGFIDLTTIIRDKDIASGLSTNFGNIPFSNTVAGHLSEFRFTAQNTRVGARFDARHGDADFLGLIETDFAGNSPGNVAVTTNSNGLRIRLGWIDFRKISGNCSAANRGVSSRPIEKERHPFPQTFFQRRISIRAFR